MGDLETVRQQPPQADDRGVAGAEIVDLDLDAEFLEAANIVGDDLRDSAEPGLRPLPRRVLRLLKKGEQHG